MELDADHLALDDDAIDIQYYLSLLLTVVRKYLKWAIPLALLAGGYAYYQAKSAVPTYTARVVMHLAPKNTNMLNMNSFYYGTDTAFQATQMGILSSKLLMRRVVEELELHHQKAQPAPQRSAFQTLIQRFRPAPERTPDPQPVEMDAEAEAERVDAYAAMLSGAVRAVPDPRNDYSNLINVTATWRDSAMAARIANAVAEQYIELIFEKAVEQAMSGQQYLAERLASLREDLRRSEARLQTFLDERDIDETELDQQQELRALSSALLEARSERIRLAGILEQLGPASTSVPSVPAIANHPRVVNARNTLLDIDRRRSELSRRYGPRHDRMIALASEADAADRALANEIREVVSILRSELSIAQQNEASLASNLAQAQTRQQSTSTDEFLLFDLQQDIEVKRGLLVAFTEMLNQGDATGPEENTNVWIVDPASPPGGANLPSAGRAVALAVAFSIIAVMGLGLLIERSRNTLATPEELEKHLSVASLGALPLLKDTNPGPGNQPLDEYMQHPRSYFSESIRSLRTSLVLKYGVDSVSRFVVTSTEAHEGKSTVALSLAAAYAQMKRTLIIDCDLRRPSLDKVLSPQEHHLVGLSDLLAGGVEIEDALVEDEGTGLTFLPAGSRTLNPLEVLGSPQFGILLNKLNRRFDVIIFDTPPCMAVSDAYLVATQGDCVIYVIKAGTTKVPAARAVIRKLRSLDVDVAGAILNRVDVEGSRYASAYDSYRMYKDYAVPNEPIAAQDGDKAVAG